MILKYGFVIVESIKQNYKKKMQLWLERINVDDILYYLYLKS